MKSFLTCCACILLFFSCKTKPETAIVCSGSTSIEQLAASELRRYIYLRTNSLLSITTSNSKASSFIILKINAALDSQEYALNSQNLNLTIEGGSDIALLYGVYAFAEQIGVRFYLHGDVIPDKKIKFTIPQLHISEKPAFQLRGILPFHDFPEGPDWWSEQDYLTVIAQLAKMKMNFIGFHTYPARENFNGEGHKAEPLVWIGSSDYIKSNGNIIQSDAVLHFTTNDSTWGYLPRNTSDFAFGAAQLFETDNFGADYMKNISAWPHSNTENCNIVNNCAKQINKAFTFAHKLKIKTCVGTETPLVMPQWIKNKLATPDLTNKKIEELYTGMFSWIAKNYPIDYYWLWTPENWTWYPVPDKEVRKTENDLVIANKVINRLGNPFSLATCGWVLGPPNDRTQFDRLLPANIPFSCINRAVGYTPVETGFANLKNRQKWSIPWLEDDPTIIATQLWAGRIRKDALDSYRYGCTGLMGIHWRTQILAPTVVSLAIESWEIDSYKPLPIDSARDLPTIDFYTDFVKTNFGLNDSKLTEIFDKLDSKGIMATNFNKGDAPLNAATWTEGPGAILDFSTDTIKKFISRYNFLQELEQFLTKIKTAGNRERFEYWINSFKFNKATLEVALAQKLLDSAVLELRNNINPTFVLQNKLLKYRENLSGKWAEMYRLQLAKTTTMGDLGIIANLEMHNLARLGIVVKHDSVLIKAGIKLTNACHFSSSYKGPMRIIVPSNQSILEKGADLYLRIRILASSKPKAVNIFWKTFNEKTYRKQALMCIGRNVFEVTLNAELLTTDFEYYIEATNQTEQIRYPATATAINNTVVLFK